MSTNTHLAEVINSPQSVDYANPLNFDRMINNAMASAQPIYNNQQLAQQPAQSLDTELSFEELNKKSSEYQMTLGDYDNNSQPAQQPAQQQATNVQNLPPNVLTQTVIPGDKVSQLNDQLNAGQIKPQEIPVDAQVLALTFLKENGLFATPNGVELNETNVNDVINYNRDLQLRNALDYIRTRGGDDSIGELFELVFNGGTLDDLNQGKDILADERYITDINTDDVNDQRAIIEIYLADGLDPNKPSHKKRLDNLDAEIDGIIDSYKGKEIAEEAKAYYLEEIDKSKYALQQEIANNNAYREKQLQEQKERESKWRSNFATSLKNREWSSEKKDAVIEQFDILEFDNGTKMPLWKYKLQMIQSNPMHAHQLMDFLAGYNHETRDFKNNVPSVEKQATNMILGILNNKNVNKTGVSGNPSETAVETANPYKLKFNR